jgi:hypothetical protein
LHILRGSEIRALRRLAREQDPPSPYVFTTERRGPFTVSAVRKLVIAIGAAAALPFPVHPHVLRHACGFKLANDGHDTRAIQDWLAIATSSTPPATPNSPPTASGISGGIRTNDTAPGHPAVVRRQIPGPVENRPGALAASDRTQPEIYASVVRTVQQGER